MKNDYLKEIMNTKNRDKYQQEYNEDIKKERVRDCLFKLYISMLTMEDDPLYTSRINEFRNTYKCLSKEERYLIQEEFANIITTQKEKNKVKKKGMINYE